MTQRVTIPRQDYNFGNPTTYRNVLVFSLLYSPTTSSWQWWDTTFSPPIRASIPSAETEGEAFSLFSSYLARNNRTSVNYSAVQSLVDEVRAIQSSATPVTYPGRLITALGEIPSNADYQVSVLPESQYISIGTPNTRAAIECAPLTISGHVGNS